MCLYSTIPQLLVEEVISRLFEVYGDFTLTLFLNYSLRRLFQDTFTIRLGFFSYLIPQLLVEEVISRPLCD